MAMRRPCAVDLNSCETELGGIQRHESPIWYVFCRIQLTKTGVAAPRLLGTTPHSKPRSACRALISSTPSRPSPQSGRWQAAITEAKTFETQLIGLELDPKARGRPRDSERRQIGL